jgi:hypothetical protein
MGAALAAAPGLAKEEEYIMPKKGVAVLLLIALLAVMVFTGCTRKLMWVGKRDWDHIEARYKRFTGSEIKEIQVEEGDTVVIDYQFEVDAGTLSLRITGPGGDEVVSLTADTDGEEQIRVEESGTYTLEVLGDKTEGSFKINWSVE